MRYNVLWIDDEYKTQKDFIGEAEQEGIDIVAFESHEEGMIELSRRPEFYHAVILDAKVKKGKEDILPGLGGLTASRDKLIDINNVGYLPYFIFTGQPDYLTSEIFNQTYGKYYTKSDDNEALFSDLKDAVQRKVEYQIEKQHERVFAVCSEKYIGASAFKPLLAILKREVDVNAFSDPSLYFISLRKVMEDLFLSFHRYGFLPDTFVKPTVSLNESSKFLSGWEEKGYKLENPVFINVVSNHVRSILSVCQPAAHRSEVDSFVSKVNSPYLLLSTTYQLLDVLIWLKEFLDENADTDVNRSRWKMVAERGVVEVDSNGIYHCGEILLSYNTLTEKGFKPGDKIAIISTTDNKVEKTRYIYPKFANKIAKA